MTHPNATDAQRKTDMFFVKRRDASNGCATSKPLLGKLLLVARKPVEGSNVDHDSFSSDPVRCCSASFRDSTRFRAEKGAGDLPPSALERERDHATVQPRLARAIRAPGRQSGGSKARRGRSAEDWQPLGDHCQRFQE